MASPSASARRIQPRAARSPSVADFYVLGLITLFLAYYGFLSFAVFELFRLADRLLIGEPFASLAPWGFSWRAVGRGVLLVLATLLSVRIAWRLALSILGLVTQKYDQNPVAEQAIELNAETYPQIHEAVSEVCRDVSAPQPDDIRVSPHAECFVTEQRRFALTTQRRLILVLGFPQLLLLTTEELKTILAHEMAHFGGDTTLVVFLFRFVETLRIAVESLSRGWWRLIDPIYWFYLASYGFFYWAVAPVQRRQELRADRVSAQAYGGSLAAHTLLKDWLIENQFQEGVGEYFGESNSREGEQNFFRWFVGRCRDFSKDGEAYLEQRLSEIEQGRFFDRRPTMRARLETMRAYPDVPGSTSTPATRLLTDRADLENRLHGLLLAGNEGRD